jgi:predicted nucleotidyltransferase
VTALESVLRRVHRDLTDARIAFALVGGLAVSARTEPRFTRDADFAVALPGDAEAEALIHNLRGQGYLVHAVVEQDAGGRLATVRLSESPQAEAPMVDLLFASSGIELEVVAEAEVIELLPGLAIAVARTGHLMALKLLARDDLSRPQDQADLRALLRVAGLDELARAREAVTLITARGYHRDRDLVSALDRMLSAAP